MSREFDKDMEEYLRARKRAGINLKKLNELVQKIIPKKKVPEHIELHEEVEVYHEKAPENKRKDSMLTKFFKREEPPHEELMRMKMAVEDTKTDIKEISKITLNIIRQLPDEQLRQFRQSENFEKMKTILKKHELIK
ncbi:MAG: hypothetical protein QW165_00320 [Candidatus Woesearchaeota archaeon]